MTINHEALKDLLARVGEATGADREIDGTVWWMLGQTDDGRRSHDPFGSVEKAKSHYGSYGAALNQFFDSSNPRCLGRIAFEQPYTSSIDAALGMVERMLPGTRPRLDFDERPRCYLHRTTGRTIGSNPVAWFAYADAATMPLAILTALVSALSQEK